MNLICVDPACIDKIWPHVSMYIFAAMVRGGVTDYRSLERVIRSGDALVWVAYKGDQIQAVAVTEVVNVNGERVCGIAACGGKDRKSWLPYIAQLEQYARDMKCKRMQIIGRKGWIRVLPDYRPTRVVLGKEL